VEQREHRRDRVIERIPNVVAVSARNLVIWTEEQGDYDIVDTRRAPLRDVSFRRSRTASPQNDGAVRHHL
jgi:hypothetical protein